MGYHYVTMCSWWLTLILAATLGTNSGIICEWHFDESTGDTAYDASGNNNHGLIYGATWVPGIRGYALQFDGEDDYINVSDSYSLDSITNELTILAWVKPIGTERGAIVARYFYEYNIPINERVFVVTVRADNRVDFAVSANGTGDSTVWLHTATTIPDSYWSHIAAVCDGDSMYIYINGIKDVNTKPAPPHIHISSHDLQIGAWNYSPGLTNTYFEGIIDEVKIYNRALSEAEIRADIDSGTIGDHSPPVMTDIQLRYVTSFAAKFTWHTDEPAIGIIKYGTVPSTYTDSVMDPQYTVEHELTLTWLSPTTTYYYVVKSVDLAGNVSQTTEDTFVTHTTRCTVYVATDTLGDYICDGDDDQVEFNLAILDLERLGGGLVHVLPDTYVIGDTVLISSNIVFEGTHMDSTVIRLEDNNTNEFWALFKIEHDSNITVRNLTVDANKYNQPGMHINSDIDGFDILYSHDVQFKHVKIVDLWTDGFEFIHSHDCVVESCSVIQAGHEGIRGIYCDRLRFSYNYVYSSGTGNAGVRLYECDSCIVEYNTLSVYGFGILINPQGGVPCGYNVYRGNILEGQYGLPAIYVAGYGTEIRGEVFTHNIIWRTVPGHEDMDHGIEFRTTGTTGKIRDILIVNNVIHNTRSGIHVDDGANVENILAKNNIIVNNRAYGIYGNVISRYNDLWDNDSGNYGGGALPDTTDISVDPLFANPPYDFHLKSKYGRWADTSWVNDDTTSPCIDAGDPSDAYDNEPEPNGDRINLGAYGNTKEASKSSNGTATDADIPRSCRLYIEGGNPIVGSITIKYGVPHRTRVKLYLYNVIGERVTTLVDRIHAAGWYTVELHEKLPAGIYFCRLVTSGHVITRKLVKLHK